MQGEELDTLLFGMFDFLHTRRHLLLATAIDDHCALCTETFGGTNGIHSRVAASDNRYVLAVQQRCVCRRVGSVHEIDAGQVFVARENAVEVLARDIHESGQTGSRADEDTLEALLLQFGNRDGLADDCVGVELHAEGTQAVDFLVHDCVRQTELRDTVFEHTAYLVERFKHVYLVAVFGGIAGESQSGRTGTHYGNLGTCRSILITRITLITLIVVIRYKTLEVTDSHRLFAHFEVDTLALALFLLGADTSADGRQRRTLFDDLCGAEDIAFLEGLDKSGDIDVHRASLHTRGVLAVEAAVRFHNCLLEREPLIDLFVQRFDTHFGTQLRHLHTRDSHAVFGFTLIGCYFD